MASSLQVGQSAQVSVLAWSRAHPEVGPGTHLEVLAGTLPMSPMLSSPLQVQSAEAQLIGASSADILLTNFYELLAFVGTVYTVRTRGVLQAVW